MTGHNPRNNDSSPQRYWQAHVKAQKHSGLSRAEYCRQHKLSYHALTYWHRKFSTPGKRGASLVPVALVPGSGIGQKNTQPEAVALKIILPNRIAVEVGDHFSPATLTKLLTTLEHR